MDSLVPPRFDWRNASYVEWNARLLDYFLGTPDEETVERIAATPEELPKAAGDEGAAPDAVAEAFVLAVRAELPPGKSFCKYCFKRFNGASSPPAQPHFFGMLWFTCLLASGYPDAAGSFRQRFRKLIGTDDQCRHGEDQRGCLNELWEQLAQWSTASGHARLLLPPLDDHLAVIGRSYYLAFPTRRDRKVLAEVLSSEDLLGFEPPIIPVVEAIESGRSRFSPDFREALDHFLEQFLRSGRDPTDSPFWRAIRHQAAKGLLDSDGDTVERAPLTLVASWDDDETVLVRIAHRAGPAPPGTQLRPLFAPIDCATRYLVDEGGSASRVVARALAYDLALPRGLRSLIRQGVLVFTEAFAGDFRLALGEDIDAADLALVRADLVQAFKRSFGGDDDESRFPGWHEVRDCRVQQLSQLPEGLTGVTQLLHTTSAPRPRIVGGVRVAGGYLWSPVFQPVIRSPSASEVVCEVGGVWRACIPTGEPGEWRFPATVDVTPPADIGVRAVLDLELHGNKLRRIAETRIRFVERVQGCVYKPVGQGKYWREGSDPEQSTHDGSALVSLDITTSDPTESADLIEYEPSARYLGPGLGEISTERAEDFPWLAVGPKKAPREVVYIGNLDAPVAPDAGESEHKGDRRTWAQAFGSAGTRTTARIGSTYVSPGTDARLGNVLALYRRRAKRKLDVSGHRALTTRTQTHWDPDPTRSPNVSGATREAVEAVAALGQGRSGIQLKEIHELTGRLTGKRDFLLWQHILRAWADAGLVDLLRRQDRSETLVVPRSPRFVLTRRGPSVDARLLGLATGDVLAAIEGLVGQEAITWMVPTTPFQPPVLCITDMDAGAVKDLSNRIGLDPPEWIRWPSSAGLPTHLAIRGELRGMFHGAPPAAYQFDARWDWNDMTFRRHATPTATHDLVSVERLRCPQRCSIYVVLVDGDPMLWSHLRSWALLRAAELWERPPFRVGAHGTLCSRGISPMHLPLPLGRLCTALGFALPGPQLDAHGRVGGYAYPFGPHLHGAVRRLLPRHWLADLGRDD